MANNFQGVSTKTYELVLAVNPFDSYTGQPLRGEATVSIEGVRHVPRRNPTGYFLYLAPPVELPPDPVVVTVESPPQYVDRRVEIPVTTLDPPAKRIAMYPSTAYSFPEGVTLLQGSVRDGSDDPVFSATVGIENSDLETRTGRDGSFVLHVDGVRNTETARPDDTLRVNPSAADPRQIRDYSQPGQPDTPTITVEGTDQTAVTVDVEITEGERNPLDTPITLQ
jgi:hypothetical protein